MLIPFSSDDIFYNQIRTFPNANFKIYDTNIFYNNRVPESGSFRNPVYPLTSTIDLYENNIDRPPTSVIYPFLTKNSSLVTFKSVTTGSFNSDFNYGDIITGSYPKMASISLDRILLGASRPHITALRNTLDRYSILSPHFPYSSSYGNKATQELKLISIPSIFFGSSIQKSSVYLNFYVSGNLQAQLVDELQNGELRQKLPQDGNSGSVGGVVLYNEGFVILTGSWSLHPTFKDHYDIFSAASTSSPRWIDFGTTGSTTARTDLTNCSSSSFELNFNGVQYIPVITMWAHARKGELNFSNNPTFVQFRTGSVPAITSSNQYKEYDNYAIKNVVKSVWNDPTGSFLQTTYLSKIGIFDKDRNLIGIAKLATPIRKRVDQNISFKLKMDI